MAEKLLTKVAVVTGAGSGIGRAIAERFLAEGAKVVVFSRTRADLEEVARKAPARVLVVDGDVTQPADLRRLAAATSRRFGDVDVLVPCAGMARVIPFADSTPDVVNEQFAVNFLGAHQTVRVFLPHLSKGSAVVFLTTGLSPAGLTGLGIHYAGKAAVRALAQTLSLELAPREIRVNSIAPGPVDTPLWDKLGLPADVLQSVRSRITDRLIPHEFGKPEDVAEAAVFLASDAARNIFGQEIVVDGGLSKL